MSEQTSGEHPSELLPWYVNGSLSDTEKGAIEAHIATCSQCRKEIDQLQQLHAQVKEIESTTQSPGELGLARLKRRIQSESIAINKKAPRRWTPTILAAATVLIVLQAGLIWNMNNQSKEQMQLLSGSTSADIQILFSPDASEEKIRALLLSVHGHIVDGPGAMGIYHIRIDANNERAEALKQAIETLRKQSDIVRFAEREEE